MYHIISQIIDDIPIPKSSPTGPARLPKDWLNWPARNQHHQNIAQAQRTRTNQTHNSSRMHTFTLTGANFCRHALRF